MKHVNYVNHVLTNRIKRSDQQCNINKIRYNIINNFLYLYYNFYTLSAPKLIMSTVNEKSFNAIMGKSFIKFNGNNYFRFEKKIKKLFESCGLKQFLESEVKAPSIERFDDETEFHQAYQLWEQQRAQAVLIIQNNCDENWEDMIEDMEDPYQIMKIFKERYVSHGQENIDFLRDCFQEFKCSSEKSMVENINNLRKIVRELRAAGEHRTDGDMRHALLKGLPDSEDYRLQRAIWEQQKFTFEQLYSKILQFERKLMNKKMKTNNTRVLSIRTTSKFKTKFKKRFQSRCDKCGKIGHVEKECKGEAREKCDFCKIAGHNEKQCWKKQKFNSNESKKYESSNVTLVLSAVQSNEKLHDNVWIIDSGSSYHVTGNVHLFNDLTELHEDDFVELQLADSRKLVGKMTGDIILFNDENQRIKITDVIYVPGLNFNLVSVSQLCEKGFKCNFTRDNCQINCSNQNALINASKDKGLYVMKLNEGKEANKILLNKNESSYDLKFHEKWHCILGHIGSDKILQLQRNHLVKGLPILQPKILKSIQCIACYQGKHHKKSYQESTRKSLYPLHIVVTDIIGPIDKPVGINRYRYILIFLDTFTDYLVTYLLRHKDETFTKFQEYVAMMENQIGSNMQGCKLKILRSDNGTEYVNTKFQEYLKSKGIRHELTVPYNPSQNGIAERKNRTIIEMVRTMLYGSKVNHYLWPYAVTWATHLLNCSVSKRSQHLNMTSHEYVTSVKPDFSTYLPFGCLVSVFVPSELRTKLNSKSQICYYLGHDSQRKGIHVYLPHKHIVFSSRDFIYLNCGEVLGNIKNNNSDNSKLFEFEIEEIHKNEVNDKQQNEKLFYETNKQDRTQEISNEKDKINELLNEKSDINSENNTELKDSEENELLDKGSDNNYKSDNSIENEMKKYFITDQENMKRTREDNDNDNDHIKKKQMLEVEIEHDESILNSLRKLTSDNNSYIENVPYNVITLIQEAVTDDPSTISEALNLKDKDQWLQAIHSEYNSIIENETFELVPRPESKPIVKCKWILKKKYKSDGSIDKYKARLVAKGFTQTYGIDYLDTFAPVVKFTSIRIILSLATQLRWNLHNCDFVTAFLNGDLEEEIFMEQPEYFVDKKHPDYVIRLRKALYGLKQAPRQWNRKLHHYLININFTQLKSDNAIYAKNEDKDIIIMGVYVDDLVITGNNERKIKELKEQLAVKFKIKDLGYLNKIIGIEVNRSKDNSRTHISQKAYVMKILKRFNMLDCIPCSTPFITNQRFCTTGIENQDSSEFLDTTKTPYAEAIGSLIYLSTCTRPDISFAVGSLSRFMAKPTKAHWEGVKRIMRYLKGTLDGGITYMQQETYSLKGYSDANFATDIDTRRSITGYIFTLGNSFISWQSKKQTNVAKSTAEAEYVALSTTSSEAKWLKQLLSEMNLKIGTIIIMSDNQSAIKIASNPIYHSRTKHIDIHWHFIRELIENKEIKVEYCQSISQPADFLTKSVDSTKFRTCLQNLGFYKSRGSVEV